MPAFNTSVNRFQDRRTLTDEAPVVMYGWGRQREFKGDEQENYNASKWNGIVDAVFLGDVVVTRIHRGGTPNGWFSIREIGFKMRTFYVKGDVTSFHGEPIAEWFARQK